MRRYRAGVETRGIRSVATGRRINLAFRLQCRAGMKTNSHLDNAVQTLDLEQLTTVSGGGNAPLGGKAHERLTDVSPLELHDLGT